MTIYQIREMLGWCSLINIGLMALSFIILCVMRSFVYRMHTQWFPMSEQTFNAILYSYLGIYKILIIVLNLVPWLALSFMGQG